VSPVRYELGFKIPEDGILHSHRRENLKSTAENIMRSSASSVMRRNISILEGSDILFRNLTTLVVKEAKAHPGL
jgi:hypothetical protein